MDDTGARPPRPEVGNPRLFNVRVSPSYDDWHLDMSALFPDYTFPEGAIVSFSWKPHFRTERPELWVGAGEYGTLWRDGKPRLSELRLTNDARDVPSLVRLEAINALHALYDAASRSHAAAMKRAHLESVARLDAEIQGRTRRFPYISAAEAEELIDDPDWWPPSPG